MLQETTLIPNRHYNVTPSDAAVFAVAMGLYIGVAGTVRVLDRFGNSADYTAIAGGYLIGRFTGVKATGTTASGIVSLYEQ